MTVAPLPVAANGKALVDMRRTRQQDTRLRAVMTEHLADVWRFVRALGVPARATDDATQEVFLVLAQRLDDVTPGAEKAFLFGTAVRIVHSLRRKHAREELAEDPDDENFEPALLSTPEDALGEKQAHELLRQLLEGLPEEMRTTLVLYEVEELSVPEIAAMLETPVGTIASRLRRGRQRLEARLQKLRMRGG